MMHTTVIALLSLTLLLAGALLALTALWRPLLNLGRALVSVTIAHLDHTIAKLKLLLVLITLKLFPKHRRDQ